MGRVLHLAGLVRCILGNPFRPLTLAAAHRTPTVVSLARAAYDERHLPSGEFDPHRLAVLADALEDAGCATADILSHCRVAQAPMSAAIGRSICAWARAEQAT